jgi:hypothetical protein
MELEYKIIYQIGGDIPINPAWIGEQLNLSLQALQKQIDKKNLHGEHKLVIKLPEGWALPIKNQGSSGQA